MRGEGVASGMHEGGGGGNKGCRGEGVARSVW